MRVFLKELAKKFAYLVAACIILAATLVTIVRFCTPILENHRSDLEKIASDLLKSPVVIKSLQISWFQYQPVISLNDVTILKKETTAPLLKINKVNLLFSIPQSIWQQKLVPTGIIVSGTSLKINQSATGELTVQGLSELGLNAVPLQNESKITDVMAWLAQVPRVILNNVDLRYTGFNKQNRFVTLYNLSIENTGEEHAIFGKAILHQELPTEISLKVTWTGHSVDLNQIQANIYLYISSLALGEWSKGMVWHGWQINAGLGSAKIWASWNAGIFEKIQSEFQAFNLDLYSQTDKSTHKINRLSGSVGWKRQGQEQIFAGDDVFIDLPDHLWPATSFYVAMTPNATGDLLPKTVNIGYLDLTDLQAFISSSPAILDEASQKLITNLQLKGNLQNAAITFAGAWNDINQISLHTNFNDLQSAQWQQYPGMKNLSGGMHWDGNQGEIRLNSKRLAVQYAAFFPNPVLIDQLTGSVKITRDDKKNWVLGFSNLQLLNRDLAANVNGTLDLFQNAAPKVDLNANFTLQQVAHVNRYLPLHILKPDLVKWLHDAFAAGELKSGRAVLRGSLNEFPFDHGEGLFRVNASVNNIDLRFAPDWPLIKRINAALEFNGRKLTVDAEQGQTQTLDVPLSKIHVEIPYLGAAKPEFVNVAPTYIETDFTQAMAYVHASPLEKTLGKMFADVKLSGPIKIKLALTVPLKKPDDTTVQGDISIANGLMDMVPWKLKLENINGEVHFTEKTSTAKSMQAILFNKPIQFDLMTVKKSNDLSVERATFTNTLNLADLETWVGVPFSQEVKGEAAVQGNIDFSLSAPMEIQVQSDLVGVAVNLADEYAKTAQEKRHLTLALTMQAGKPIRMQVGYGGLLNAALILDKQEQKFKLLGADLRFGTGAAAWPEEGGIYITGQFKHLDWDKIKGYAGGTSTSSLVSVPLKNVDVRVNEIKFGNQSLSQLHVQATPNKSNWDVNLDSPELSGKLTIPTNLTAQGLITAQLQKFYLHTSSGGAHALPLLDLNTFPALSIVVNDLKFNAMQLGQLTLKAMPEKNGLQIQSLSLSSPRIDLRATGDWLRHGNNYVTRLQGTANSNHVSELLANLDFKVNNFVAGKGDLKFNLNWNDAPYAPDLASINGTADMKLGQGRIVDIGKENGAKMDLGRMLSIFSLQTIPRRLTLDFSDIFQKGYSFDSVRGDFTLKNGDLYSKNLQFEGPVAQIGINGRIGLKNKDYDFILAVTAHVTSSLPLAATLLTGNPLIGLGAFAVNSVIGSTVSSATSNYYTVTGSWDNPIWKSTK